MYVDELFLYLVFRDTLSDSGFSSLIRIFTSARKVLQGACHMVAMQLATEPLVRQSVRQVFQTRALLSVKPTKKGKKVCMHVHVYTMYMYMYINVRIFCSEHVLYVICTLVEVYMYNVYTYVQ